MVNSRDKGKRGERAVAALLQSWWQAVEPECQFVSTPQSGGWSTPEVRAASRTAGDLTTTAKRFPFCVEVKWRERWSVDRLMREQSSPVWGWWRQCLRDAAVVSLIPMLWFRKSRHPWYVMVPEMYFIDRRITFFAAGAKACNVLFANDVLGVDPHQLALRID